MSAPARVRVAVIGLGMASTPHARSLADLHDRVEVAAVFSPSLQRREAFAATWGFPIRDSIEAIFADSSITAVLLLTPPNTHLELVQRAAAAHKHILLEKPLDISLERSELLVKTAEEADVKLAVVLQNRFRPTCERLSALIAEDRPGAIVSASARINNWRPQSYYDQPGRGTMARDGGGVLLTQAIHTLDLLVAFAGIPMEVKAFARRVRSTAWKPRTSPWPPSVSRAAQSEPSPRPPAPTPVFPMRSTSSERRARHGWKVDNWKHGFMTDRT